MRPERYSVAQRGLHWLVAACVAVQLTVGLTLGRLGFEGTRDTFGIDATNLLYKYHKTLGVIVMVLMLVRLALRLRRPPPPHVPPLPGWMAVASRANHWALYALLIGQPVVGWLATAAGGFPVEFFGTTLPGLIGKDEALSHTLYAVHYGIGLAILALVALHVAAALMHWLGRRDGVMQRMSLP